MINRSFFLKSIFLFFLFLSNSYSDGLFSSEKNSFLKVDDAFKRKLKEELSIKIKNNFILIGIYEDFFKVSSFGSHLYHTVSFVYEYNIDNLSIDLDSTSSEWEFHDDLPTRLKNKMRFINV